MPKRKRYYFICRKCGKRKPEDEESVYRPGLCIKCRDRQRQELEIDAEFTEDAE